jgi:hypothetical protein
MLIILIKIKIIRFLILTILIIINNLTYKTNNNIFNINNTNNHKI